MEKRENKDGKLVRLAQSGDNDAMEQLCAEYKDTVRMLARPYFLIGADRDDLIQEGMIGLYKAIRDYREDHNSSFASFAELCITRQILSAINASRRQKHQPLNSYISLYRTPESGDRELLELIEQPGGDPEERFISRETAAALRRVINTRLTPLEKRVTELFLQGMTYRQIAEAVPCPIKSVDNALSPGKKEAGGGDGEVGKSRERDGYTFFLFSFQEKRKAERSKEKRKAKEK